VSGKSETKVEAKAAVKNASLARRMALLVTAGIAVAICIVVFVFVRAQGQRASEPAAASSAILPGSTNAAIDSPATQAVTDLDKAADAVGFRVTTGPGIGEIENLPAETTLLAPSRSLLPVGASAPDFTLPTPEGTKVRLSDFRGKTVFLEFFATWCPHCQAEAPHLLGIQKVLPSSVTFLSVNGDSEDAASVHAFSRHFGLPWQALLDPGLPPGSFSRQGGIGPVSRAYGLSLFPTFYIIDANGRIAWRADREQPDALLVARLRDASGS